MVGVATTGATHAIGIVTVTSIYDNIGDTVELKGIVPDSSNSYNTLYRITGITTGSTKQVQVASASTIGVTNTTGLGVTDTSVATAYVTGQALNVSAFNFNKDTGVGVVTTAQRHGLSVDNKVCLLYTSPSPRDKRQSRMPSSA